MAEAEAAYHAWVRRMPRFCETPATTRARAFAASVHGWADYAAAFERRWGFAPPKHLRAARAFFSGPDPFTQAALDALEIRPLPALLEINDAAAPQARASLLQIGDVTLSAGPGAAPLPTPTLLGAVYAALHAAPQVQDEASFQRRWALDALAAFEAPPP